MQNETHNNLYMQVQEICKGTIREILQLYKINFDFYYARTRERCISLMGTNLHVQDLRNFATL